MLLIFATDNGNSRTIPVVRIGSHILTDEDDVEREVFCWFRDSNVFGFGLPSEWVAKRYRAVVALCNPFESVRFGLGQDAGLRWIVWEHHYIYDFFPQQVERFREDNPWK